MRMYFIIDPFLFILLSSVLMVAAVIDIRVHKIPNLLTFPTMVLGLVYYGMTNGWNGLLFSLGGLALGIALFFIIYLMGGMGAGDVKLMGAVGAIIGSKGILLTALFSALVGGVYAVIILLFNIQYLKDLIKRSYITIKSFVFTRQFIPIPAERYEKKPKLCYGVAIAIGTFSYLLLEFYGYNPI
ncbi:MAG: prepilin peptidase [Thermodesulfobacteriota bacterium]|nr:prepilin peptidase [Thermodesulfobacteriota bacterium]